MCSSATFRGTYGALSRAGDPDVEVDDVDSTNKSDFVLYILIHSNNQTSFNF